MSIVVNVLFNGKSYLAGDQQVSRKVGNRTYPVAEDGHKVYRLSNFASIGFTGNYELSKGVFKNVAQWVDRNPFMGQFADIIANQMDQAFRASSDILGTNFTAVVSGITTAGNLANYTFHFREGYSMEKHSVTPQAPVIYSLLGEPCAEQLDFPNRLITALNASSGDHETAIINCLKEFVVSVSQICDTVNDRVELIIVPSEQSGY